MMSTSGGTNLDTKTATCEDDLIAASSTGCDTLVELFMNEGIDVNVKRGLYGNAYKQQRKQGTLSQFESYLRKVQMSMR